MEITLVRIEDLNKARYQIHCVDEMLNTLCCGRSREVVLVQINIKEA